MQQRIVATVLLVAGLCAVGHAMSFLPDEFSARLTVKHGKMEYAAAIYVRNDNKGQVLWVKVQNDDKAKPVRSVYKSDTAGKFNFFKAALSKGEPDLNQADCDSIPLGSLIDLESMSYLPRPVDEPARLYTKTCPECDAFWTFEVRDKLFILLTAGPAPKFILGSDGFLAKVVAFAPGKSEDFKEDVAATCNSLASKLKTLMEKDTTMMPADQQKLKGKPKDLGKPLHKFEGYADAVTAYMFGPATRLKMGTDDLPVKKDPKVEKPFGDRGGGGQAELVPPVRFAETRVGRCTKRNIGDGKCDPACNTADFNFDAGDCCEGKCKLYEYYVSKLPPNHPVKEYRHHVCGATGYSCDPSQDKAVCGFFHGFMNAFGKAPGATNAFGPGENPMSGLYWANMANEMQGICRSVAYNNHETVTNGWNQTQLQTDYYTQARQIFTAAQRLRLDPVVFAHSMANMLLTGACLDQGNCDVKWYDLSGPIRGSRSAMNPIGVGMVNGIRAYMDYLDWCSPGMAPDKLRVRAMDTLAPTFRDLALDTANPDRLSSVAGGSVAGRSARAAALLNGAACGYKGIASWASPASYAMFTLKSIVYGYQAEADGVVGLDECELYRDFAAGTSTLTQFGAFRRDDPLSPWFHYPGNHQSATGGMMEGDSGKVLTYMRAQADGFPKAYILYLRTRRLI